jgi:hypothetical protein
MQFRNQLGKFDLLSLESFNFEPLSRQSLINVRNPFGHFNVGVAISW